MKKIKEIAAELHMTDRGIRQVLARHSDDEEFSPLHVVESKSGRVLDDIAVDHLYSLVRASDVPAIISENEKRLQAELDQTKTLLVQLYARWDETDNALKIATEKQKMLAENAESVQKKLKESISEAEKFQRLYEESLHENEILKREIEAEKAKSWWKKLWQG